MTNLEIINALSTEDVQELMALNPEALVHIEAENVGGHGLQARLHVLTDEPGRYVREFFTNSTPAWHYDRAREWQKLIKL